MLNQIKKREEVGSHHPSEILLLFAAGAALIFTLVMVMNNMFKFEREGLITLLIVVFSFYMYLIHK